MSELIHLMQADVKILGCEQHLCGLYLIFQHMECYLDGQRRENLFAHTAWRTLKLFTFRTDARFVILIVIEGFYQETYRNNTRNFLKNRREYNNPVPFRTGHDKYNRVRDFPYIWEQGLKDSIDGFGINHNWTKKSVLWDLPYWVNVKWRHNLDVMHIEKNVFENLYNTLMDVKGKTKDNGIKCRNDISIYCNRPELHLRMNRGRMVANKAKYTLSSTEQSIVLEWITRLGFLVGFASRLRSYVNLQERKLTGYKSHDAHVFLERLMSIAFRGLLPGNIWGPRLATWNPQLTPLVYRIFMKKCGKILRDGWHNLRAGRSTEGPVFSNPAATVKAIAKFKSIILKRTVYCNDMYKRLKIGKDGTYLDKDGATIESDLEASFRALQERFNGEIPEAEDLEASAPILGYSQRIGLPRVVGSAATLVIGSRFQAMSTQGNLNSQTTTQSQGLSQDAFSLLTKIAQQFEDLRMVVEAHAQQLQKLKGAASTSSAHSLDEVSDEESD
ncbi:hypothetical protein QQ045_027659 [Rhodiola kirilowii]